eukprot:COSAG01_NODE_7306_length_3258_cov_13.176638_3_plen_55_part_01
MAAVANLLRPPYDFDSCRWENAEPAGSLFAAAPAYAAHRCQDTQRQRCRQRAGKN